jgi:signal transduction histidine kinase
MVSGWIDGPPPRGAEVRAAQFTDLVGTAIANAESRAELVTSRARIVTTADQTRRTIERDLHDGAQQRLVTLTMKLRALEDGTAPRAEAVKRDVAEIAAGLDDVLDDLRETARGLHPVILSRGGLGPALKALGRRSPVPVELDVRAQQRLPEPVEVAAYYVVAEALTNAAKTRTCLAGESRGRRHFRRSARLGARRRSGGRQSCSWVRPHRAHRSRRSSGREAYVA